MSYASTTVKEITQNISKERYNELKSIGDVFLARQSVKNTEVPENKRKLWYGCKILRLENEYVLIHTVDIKWEGDTI